MWWIWWKHIHFSTLPFVVWQTLLRTFKKGWRAKTCQYKRDSSLHNLEILLPFHIFDMGVFYSNRRHILFWLLDGDDGGSQSQQHTYMMQSYTVFLLVRKRERNSLDLVEWNYAAEHNWFCSLMREIVVKTLCITCLFAFIFKDGILL